MILVKDGNLAQPFRDVLVVSGLALIWGSAFLIRDIYQPTLWVYVSIGVLIAGLGSACHLASKAGIRPFCNSYKEARDSYKMDSDKQKGAE